MVKIYVDKSTYNTDVAWQWDKNRELVIYGLSFPKPPEVHFANSEMDATIVRESTMDKGGVIRVMIPNSLLQKPLDIKVYLGLYQGSQWKSMFRFEIPMKPRKKPADYVLENDEEVYSFLHLERTINDALRDWDKRAGELETHVTNNVNNMVEYVDNSIVSLENRLDNIESLLKEHINTSLTSLDGVHGLKLSDGKLQYYNPDLGDWEDLGVTNSPEDIPEEEIDTGVGKVYSFLLDLTQTNPAQTVTYLDDSVNYTTPESWDNCPIFKQIKPCILKDGQVKYYLNPDNYDKKLDGTPSNLTGADGDVMVEFPFLAYKVENYETGETTGNDFQKVKISISTDYSVAQDEGWNTYHMQYDDAGTCSTKFYNSAYFGCKIGDTIVSVAKDTINDIYYDTVKNVNDALSENTFITHVSFYYLMWFLMVLRYKTTYINGVTNLVAKGYENYKIGENRIGGLFSGCGDLTLSNSVKILGSEYTVDRAVVMGGTSQSGSRQCYVNQYGTATYYTPNVYTHYVSNCKFKRNELTTYSRPADSADSGNQIIGSISVSDRMPHFGSAHNGGHDYNRGSCLAKSRDYHTYTQGINSGGGFYGSYLEYTNFCTLYLCDHTTLFDISSKATVTGGGRITGSSTDVFNGDSTYCFHFTYLPPVTD